MEIFLSGCHILGCNGYTVISYDNPNHKSTKRLQTAKITIRSNQKQITIKRRVLIHLSKPILNDKIRKTNYLTKFPVNA